MILTKLLLAHRSQPLTGSLDLLEAWRNEPGAVIWMDLTDNPKTDEAQLLEQHFGLHPLAIQDAQRDRHPPKLEAFENHTFLLLKGLSVDSQGIDFKTIQLALFVGERFLVTRHSGRSVSVELLSAALEQHPAPMTGSPAAMALKLCRFMANRYTKILLDLEPRLEELEEEMLADPDDKILSELIRHKSDLKRLRRYATYHEQLFRDFRENSFPQFSDGEHGHQITDVWEQYERIESLATLYHDMAADLIEGYISVASHRLNQIMKVLTIVTAVFVPLGFLAGIYGMNFEYMPELHSPSGYFILLGVMALIATTLLIVFRKIRWL